MELPNQMESDTMRKRNKYGRSRMTMFRCRMILIVCTCAFIFVDVVHVYY